MQNTLHVKAHGRSRHSRQGAGTAGKAQAQPAVGQGHGPCQHTTTKAKAGQGRALAHLVADAVVAGEPRRESQESQDAQPEPRPRGKVKAQEPCRARLPCAHPGPVVGCDDNHVGRVGHHLAIVQLHTFAALLIAATVEEHQHGERGGGFLLRGAAADINKAQRIRHVRARQAQQTSGA